MYAIVRTGGRQVKVTVGDVIEIDRRDVVAGDTVRLPALLLVDGSTVTTDADALADVTVSAEVLGATKGPKITILRYKNKTRSARRQGHRQHYRQVRITDIGGVAAPTS